MKKILALALCLLSILACAKRPAPLQVAAVPTVLPQFERLNELYGQFQGFRNDQLFLRHGFTANFPQSDWLQQVQALGQDPELSERARLLASLAVAARIHGDAGRVTRGFEDRFIASLRTPGPSLPEEEAPTTGDAIGHAEADALPPQASVAPEGDAALEPAALPAADDARIVEQAGQLNPALPDAPATPQDLEAPETLPTPAQSDQAPTESAAATPADAMTQPMPAEPIPTVPAAVKEAQPAQGQEMLPAPSPQSGGGLAAGPAVGAGATDSAGSPSLPAAEFQTGEELADDVPLPSPVPPVPGTEGETGTDLAAEAGPTTGMAAPVTPETTAASTSQATRPATLPPVPALQPQKTQDDTADRITILFTGDTRGLVSPQPGIAGTLGGVARRLPAVERFRAGTPSLMLLDAGDAFASSFPQAQGINKALVRAMNRMRYDALGLGLHDLAMGEVALRELVSISSFPFVCSNLEFQAGAIPWIKPFALLQRGGRKIAVISLLTPDPAVKITGARLIPPRQALAKLMTQLATQADAVVLMTQAGRDEISSMIGAARGLTVILGDAGSGFQNDPRYIPAVPRGMGLTLVELDSTDGAFRPGRSMPLLTSGQQNNNILEILEDIPQ